MHWCYQSNKKTQCKTITITSIFMVPLVDNAYGFNSKMIQIMQMLKYSTVGSIPCDVGNILLCLDYRNIEHQNDVEQIIKQV